MTSGGSSGAVTDGREPLDRDAARFLEQFGAGLAFPLSARSSADEVRDYLAGERSRLMMTPGAALLDEDAVAVTTKDVTLLYGLGLRTYTPAEQSPAPRPVIIYLHGGGWVSGSVNLHDSTCRLLASLTGAVVVSVGYRLAPENLYPVALDDCDRALQWVRTKAPSRLDVDPQTILLAGTSSGATLAAALCLRARDRGDSGIVGQGLIYPALDATMSSPSYGADVNGRDYFISAEHMRWYWEQYAGGADLFADPEFSPLAAESFAGLPPAVVVSAEYDLLRDDAIRFHERLIHDGVQSVRLHYAQIHGFMTLMDSIPQARHALLDFAAELRHLIDAARHRAPARGMVPIDGRFAFGKVLSQNASER